ncbi:hypothetical protein [Rhizobium leguminosarum]|uniref:hypothetical protein n=1 Tax=Rhizobium leguminosarum TaxID=384 RepID=UPI003F94556F
MLMATHLMGGDGIVDDHENLSAVTTMEGAEMHAEQDESFYNVRSLRLRYGPWSARSGTSSSAVWHL